MPTLPAERARAVAKLFAAPGTPAAKAAGRIAPTDATHERNTREIAQRLMRERKAKQSGVTLRRGR